MSVVGIDFGNGYCVIAAAQKGGVDVLANEVSSRLTATMVSFGEKERYIGEAAASQYMRNLKNTITDIKRLLGHTWAEKEVQEEISALPFTVKELPNHDVGVEVLYDGEKKTFSMVAITAMLLQKLKETAEKALDRPVKDVVISVPGFWTDKQRRAMLDASKIANLNCLRLLNDTCASALAYGIYKTNLSETEPIRVLFFDMGNTSTSATVVEFVKGKLKVLSAVYDRTLGGRSFDKLLLEHFSREFKEKFKIDVETNQRAKKRLEVACEKLKKVLNTVPEAPIAVDSIMNDIDVRGTMKKEEFEKLVQPLVERAMQPIKQALEEAGLKPEDLTSTELLGGASRLTSIKKRLGEFLQKEPSQTLNSEEAVARGCALQCAILSPIFKVRDFAINDISPYPVGISWKTPNTDPMITEENSQELFPKRTIIPSSKMITFQRTEPLEISATYSHPELLPPGSNPFIGRYTIGNIPVKEGEPSKVRVKVKLDIHGIFALESAQLIETVEEAPETPENQTKVETQTKEEKKTEEESKPEEAQSGEESKPEETPKGEEVPMEEEGAKPQENAPETKEQKPEDKNEKKPETKKKKIRRVDLQYEEEVNGLSNQERLSLCEEEAKMAAADKLAIETAERKNAVESYVYDMRSKLSGELSAFAPDTEKESFLKMLNDTEEWLYDEGENETKSVYSKKLEELRAVGEPIKKRFYEHENRYPVLDSLRSTIQQFQLSATSQDPKYDHIEKEELQKITEECSKVEKWISETMQKQDQLPKHVNPVVTCDAIKKKKSELEQFCNPILNKPKPKPKVEPPKEPEKKKEGEAPKEGETPKGDEAPKQETQNSTDGDAQKADPVATAEMDLD